MVSGVGELTVVPFLLDSGVAGLDAVIATHAHSDHIQGLLDVLRTLNVRRLFIPSLDDETCFAELLEAAAEKGIPVTRCSSGMVINLDRHTTVYVLNPEAMCRADRDSLNDTSLVLRLCYKNTSVLLMGDAEKPAEERMLNSAFAQWLDADVIKIGHHGSNTSTSEAFIEMVSPAAAVISAGRNNFGHPSEEVLGLLEDKGIEYFRTDESGAVVLQSDGARIRIRGLSALQESRDTVQFRKQGFIAVILPYIAQHRSFRVSAALLSYDTVQFRKRTLHLQELYSSARAEPKLAKNARKDSCLLHFCLRQSACFSSL